MWGLKSVLNLPNPRSEPYDPYLPRNGSSSNAAGSSQGGNAKTAAIQQQIDDTVGIMRENITKVAERGERLDSLQDKTGEDNRVQRFASVRLSIYFSQTTSLFPPKGSVVGQTEYGK